MFLHITDDKTGALLARRPLADAEAFDLDALAASYATGAGCFIERGSGYVPTGCGDITVTVREADDPQSAACWNCASYFLTADPY